MYLDNHGTTINAFKNNFAGRRWTECFVEHHKKELSQRFCSNIKRVRAAVNAEIINNFFEHLTTEIKDVPPDCIYNYDETNLFHDAGKKRVLSKRGCKYPQAIKNSTKTASLMVCGNAAGEVLPPYVNYKAEIM
ncbi:unnamed protein product [Acanthoscelides obtectus]|uniref:Uncharacterized protein n=1 Tax=Acanthoscelides obtectus TaxID=200917 RepID=A0A9P0JTP5_ACAOB|nr:unnamed protein product [Acanthoscelides obtectus]CAK1667260.1 hypothetical protein AOBTE_LOCUS25744 [Acanthoscelides obtectus]